MPEENKKTLSFFRFPKNKVVALKWEAACGKENVNVKNGHICSAHFDAEAYKETSWMRPLLGYISPKKRTLKWNAVPTLNLDSSASEGVQVIPSTVLKINEMLPQEKPEASTSGYSINVESASEDKNEACTSIVKKHDKISQISDICQEMNELREKYLKLQLLNQTLQRELAEQKRKERDNVQKNVQEILSSVFTPGQIKMIINPSQKKTHWSSQDIAAAISLRSVSPKAYVYLRKARNFPLPGMSTLQRWTAAFDLTEGILKNVMETKSEKNEKIDFN